MVERLSTASPLAGLHVLSMATPDTPHRETARRMVRQALSEALGELFPGEDGEIALISAPGTPIRLAAPGRAVGLSVSHEPGRSLAAIYLHGPVGIDLMRLGTPLPDIDVLGRDYLGPAVAAEIARCPEGERQQAFARAWTAHEASLKCLGLALAEWSPALAGHLSACTTLKVEMPPGWVATVATAGSSGSRVRTASRNA